MACLLFSQSSVDDDEYDSVLTDVRYLYEEPTHYVDPNDMLADFDALRKAASPTAPPPPRAEADESQ